MIRKNLPAGRDPGAEAGCLKNHVPIKRRSFWDLAVLGTLEISRESKASGGKPGVG
jgi:hypothetical protein